MEFQNHNPNYIVLLTHEEVVDDAPRAAAFAQLFPYAGPIADNILPVMRVMDVLGGRNGVEISWVGGTDYFLILPRASGVWGAVIANAQTILAIGAVLSNPVGAGLWFLTGEVIDLFRTPAGQVHASADAVKDHERFVLITSGGGQVLFRSHRGMFSANGDDRFLYGDNPHTERDERFDLLGHADGRVSLHTWLNTYVCSDRNRGRRLVVDRDHADEWEKFTVEFQPGGVVALRDSEGKYVSVA